MSTIISNESKQIEISSDLNLSLSLIDSGCILFEEADEAVFLIKDSEAIVDTFSELISLKIAVKAIIRPEFPTILLEIKLKNKKNVSFKYDYFLSTESIEELNLLEKLNNQSQVELFFYDSCLRNGITFMLDKNENLQLEKAINEIGF